MLLNKRDLWNLIINDVPAEPDEKWILRDGQTIVVMGLSLEENQKTHERRLKNANEFWEVPI